MRKIETAEIIEKKKNRNKLLVSLVLIILMVTSTIGFALVFNNPNGAGSSNNNGEKVNYNGVDFLKQANGYWLTNFQGNNIITFYNPKETENIELNVAGTIGDYSEKPLYYVADNQSINNLGDAIQNLNLFSLRSQEVCLKNSNCRNKDLVEKDCSNNIIILRTSEQIKTYKENNCIFIEAPEDQQKIIVDKLIFRLLGIQ